MNKRIILLFTLSIALLLLGCARKATIEGPGTITISPVDPAAQVGLGEGGKITIRLGLVNLTDQELAERKDFAGQWVLLNREGEVRASGHLYTTGPLHPHERSFPLTWHAELEAGTYTLKWGAPSVGTTIIEFEVQRDDVGVEVGALRQQTTDEYLVDQRES